MGKACVEGVFLGGGFPERDTLNYVRKVASRLVAVCRCLSTSVRDERQPSLTVSGFGACRRQMKATSSVPALVVRLFPPTPALVFALFAACSVIAYRVAAGYLLPAVLVALSAHIANKIHRVLRPLSELELLPPDLPGTEARVESWLRDRDQSEAPLEPGAESCVTWAAEAGEPTELCVVYLHGWGASPPELSPVPEQLAAALGARGRPRLGSSSRGLAERAAAAPQARRSLCSAAICSVCSSSARSAASC